MAQNVPLLFFVILKAVTSSQVKLLRHIILTMPYLTFRVCGQNPIVLHSNETPSIQEYFHGMVLFIVVLSLWMKSYGVTIQIKPLRFRSTFTW